MQLAFDLLYDILTYLLDYNCNSSQSIPSKLVLDVAPERQRYNKFSWCTDHLRNYCSVSDVFLSVCLSRQCSLCASPSSSDAEFPEVDPDQPRQLREKNLIRGPVKYTSQFADLPTRVCLN